MSPLESEFYLTRIGHLPIGLNEVRMQSNGIFKLFCIYFFAAFLIGCARPQNENTNSQIKLQFSGVPSKKLNSMSECSQLCLHHIVVNVSGAGFPSIDLSIDPDKLESDQLVLDVPSGSNRLFQVIAVYFDSSTASMMFYYGDTVQSLTGGSRDIVINVKSLNQTSSQQAQITGRWLGYDTTPQYPTGELRVMYRPPNGRPAMTIEKSSMVSGWFTAFSLQGLQFDYVVRTISGEKIILFENKSYEDLATSTSVLKLSLPIHYKDSKLNQPLHVVYGFYGSSNHTANNSICYNSTDSAVLDNYDANLDGSVKLNWSGLSFAGGSDDDAFSACGGDVSFPYLDEEYIKVVPEFLSNGKSTAGGFAGIFAGDTTNSQMKFFSVDSTSFKTSVVPGGRLLADQAVLFVLPPEAEDLWRDEAAPCTEFAQGQFGAQRRGTLNLTVAGQTATGTHSLSAQEMSFPKAICPSIQGRIFNAGVMDRGGEIYQSVGVVDVVGNNYAFAAIRSDGSVVTWGDSASGGSG